MTTRTPVSQTWTLIGSDREPYPSDQPGTLGGHRSAASTAVSTAPLRYVPSPAAAMSPTVCSSSPKSTRRPPATGRAASAARPPTQAGRRSKERYKEHSKASCANTSTLNLTAA
jgi:hypothetical protein